jgi:hypothetical protein
MNLAMTHFLSHTNMIVTNLIKLHYIKKLNAWQAPTDHLKSKNIQMIYCTICSIIALFFISSFSFGQSSEKIKLEEFLSSIDDLEFIYTYDAGKNQYKYTISLPQYVNQQSKTGPKFMQKLYLTHLSDSLPTVMVTEGYSVRANNLSEPARLLSCNQIIVEHRYFGESIPDSMDWSQLTTANAAADHHQIYKTFSKFYRKHWISTGISKGGQTCIFYKYYYPDDMQVCIPYVAPLNLEQEDVRINWFLRHVGTKEENMRILDYQKLMLQNFDSIFPYFKTMAVQDNQHFAINDTATYEFMVLEFPFSYFQWGSFSLDSIPDEMKSAEQMMKPMRALDLVNFYYKSTLDQYLPFMVQAYRELGYYDYDLDNLKPYLRKIENSSNIAFLPIELRFEYDDDIMNSIYDYIHNHGDRMVFIYGELDPWSSNSVNPDSRTDALKMVLSGGSHSTRIRHFSDEEIELILKTIKNWLDE